MPAYLGIPGTAVDPIYLPDEAIPGFLAMGYIITTPRPEVVYHEHGDNWLQTDATWLWIQTFPSLELPVTINNIDGTLHWAEWVDVPNVLLPSNLGAATQVDMTAVQTSVTGLSTNLATTNTTLGGVSTVASGAATAAATANAALAALPSPTKFEIVTAILSTGGTLSATFTKTYSVERYCIPITNWSGNVQLTAILGTPTATGVTVTGKKSVGTLIVGGSPFTDCVAGDVVKFFVVGR